MFMLSFIYLFDVDPDGVVSNNAVAVLLTPIAIGGRATFGADPRRFVVAVCLPPAPALPRRSVTRPTPSSTAPGATAY